MSLLGNETNKAVVKLTAITPADEYKEMSPRTKEKQKMIHKIMSNFKLKNFPP